MPITLFHTVIITFADASATYTLGAGHVDRVYRVVEVAPNRWTISEDGQPVAMSEAEHKQLAAMLAQLDPLPDPNITPDASGCDGTWITCVVQRGDTQTGYRWWVFPPRGWGVVGSITEFVKQLADKPRIALAQKQKHITQEFFAALAARDLPRMLVHYHPDVEYSSPLFELHGSEVGAMWRMWWHYLPDVRVVCKQTDIWSSGASWKAIYTFPPTGRRVTHSLTADLSFANDRIVQQRDRFNVHEWAEQAYGIVGGMTGGWRLFEWRLRARARAQLATFL